MDDIVIYLSSVSLSRIILSMPGYIKQHLWLESVILKYDISVVKFLLIKRQ